MNYKLFFNLCKQNGIFINLAISISSLFFHSTILFPLVKSELSEIKRLLTK